MNPLRIGINDCGKFDNYRRWMESVPGVEVVRLSMNLKNAAETESCDGILFSGGEDVQPALYGKPEYIQEFHLQEIIPERDHFEYDVMEKALAEKKPVLGICRGLQLINVYLGGTLVPDIPTLLQSEGHSKKNGQDQVHSIRVEPDTLLEKISGLTEGTVNSAHHQSAALPAPGLKISAYSDSTIVEAMEWSNPENKSWLLMVQWHPERMTDQSSPFSRFVKNAFLEACRETE